MNLREKVLAEILSSDADQCHVHIRHTRQPARAARAVKTFYVNLDDDARVEFRREHVFSLAPEIELVMTGNTYRGREPIPFTWIERYKIANHIASSVKKNERAFKRKQKLWDNTFPHDPPTLFDQAVIDRYNKYASP